MMYSVPAIAISQCNPCFRSLWMIQTFWKQVASCLLPTWCQTINTVHVVPNLLFQVKINVTPTKTHGERTSVPPHQRLYWSVSLLKYFVDKIIIQSQQTVQCPGHTFYDCLQKISQEFTFLLLHCFMPLIPLILIYLLQTLPASVKYTAALQHVLTAERSQSTRREAEHAQDETCKLLQKHNRGSNLVPGPGRTRGAYPNPNHC